MQKVLDGNAIVYCEGAFNTPNGKTAHGLVRFTKRYNVLAVIDSRYAGQDAGEVLDQVKKNIPIVADLQSAVSLAAKSGNPAKFMVIGLAPDGGRLSKQGLENVKAALILGLNVDCGLHDFLTENAELMQLARDNNCQIRDIRKPPEIKDLHFFTGNIEKVNCLKLAVLGTDSAVGKRTTAWILVNGMLAKGKKAELVGTGQTAWMQGAKYSLVMDSIINDFVAGEIEYAVYSAWQNEHPDVIIIEGQGSLMNPAYPGGFEILAAGRPDYVILQHASRRLEYDGFPGYPLHPPLEQIKAIEMISGKKVIAITLNHENIPYEDIPAECDKISQKIGLPCFDVLVNDADDLLKIIENLLPRS
ncbi:MAG: DUF1611 domain-containing protein [Candidatus Cloacimonadales bacterium]|nr:DUF1611 domain-containing protein [Candidatus Cloacimonadales bacterium]